MSKVHLQQAEIKVEYIPAHKFIGIWDITSSSYGEFWQGGRSCDEIAARWKVCPILHFQNNWARPQDGSTRMDKRDTFKGCRYQESTTDRFRWEWNAGTNLWRDKNMSPLKVAN
ncbi:hypothetical protein C172_16231 [Paenibacillus sp. FSL H8-457]|nr:hypothetical protein C172_16231 [Paenibacillus sp. FSL H8-457]